MQYLVLLRGLALVDHGKLFLQARTHVTRKDRARAERYEHPGGIASKLFSTVQKNEMICKNKKPGKTIGEPPTS